jgi:nitrogen fixation protein NifU and related proteins
MSEILVYNENVLEHFRAPRNTGILKDADGQGHAGDPTWGIDMELYLKIENGIITQAKTRTFGCAATVAVTSVITEMLQGKTLEQALAITAPDITGKLGGIPSSKAHCARLGVEMINSAVEDYHQHHPNRG